MTDPFHKPSVAIVDCGDGRRAQLLQFVQGQQCTSVAVATIDELGLDRAFDLLVIHVGERQNLAKYGGIDPIRTRYGESCYVLGYTGSPTDLAKYRALATGKLGTFPHPVNAAHPSPELLAVIGDVIKGLSNRVDVNDEWFQNAVRQRDAQVDDWNRIIQEREAQLLRERVARRDNGA